MGYFAKLLLRRCFAIGKENRERNPALTDNVLLMTLMIEGWL